MSRTTRITTAAIFSAAALAATAGTASAAAPPQSAASSASTASFASAAAGQAATAPVTQAVQGVLPKPTGPYEAGEDVLHLVDRSRPDPWLPSAGPRQLMVSMFYPARQGTGQPAPYMTPGEAQGFVTLRVPPGTPVTAEDFTRVQTYAFTGAKPVPGKFPLIVLSPGLENPRTTLTSLATELASHGYVVALVGHTYEDSGETFPDGTTSPCLVCGQSGPPIATPEQITASRAVDVSFVLDRLLQGRAWRLGHLIDKDDIGMAGHSIGGAATAVTMLDDPRIRAGANMDGTFFPPVPATGIGHRPFLMLAHPDDPALGPDPTWTQTWADLDGSKRWLTLAGANHASFTDITILAEELGVPLPGTLGGLRGSEITRAYVTAFFDKTLKGKCEPLLDGPSAAYPEVTFQP
jgi:predicted dienelactone hydrolase